MTRKTFVRILVIMAIALALGGASLIVAGNRVDAGGDAPSGFFH